MGLKKLFHSLKNTLTLKVIHQSHDYKQVSTYFNMLAIST